MQAVNVPSPMQLAFFLAKAAALENEVPIGAVVVCPAGNIVGIGYNLVYTTKDPTAHAEVVAIRQAAATLNCGRLDGCRLYVTLEPCAMCADLIAKARFETLVYGASDIKSGGIEQGAQIYHHKSTHHKPQVIKGVGATEAERLLKSFFKARRLKKKPFDQQS
tara:strand:+ start:95 stop:583 length:489 start_codon:yes stop_codon:yes gene_type:complete